MEKSEQINELAAALVKAQAQIEAAERSAVNPHLRSKYADLKSVWDACRPALTEHGLSVIQLSEDEDGTTVRLATLLLHASGQWIKGTAVLPLPKADPQGYGSALTYARRYSLAAMVGVAPEDDDGNAASGEERRQRRPARNERQDAPAPTPESQGDRGAQNRQPSAAGSETDKARGAFFADFNPQFPGCQGPAQEELRHWIYAGLAGSKKPVDPAGWPATMWEKLHDKLRAAIKQGTCVDVLADAKAHRGEAAHTDPFEDQPAAQGSLPAMARGL